MDIGYRLQCCHLRSKSKIYMQYACNMFAIQCNIFQMYLQYIQHLQLPGEADLDEIEKMQEEAMAGVSVFVNIIVVLGVIIFVVIIISSSSLAVSSSSFFVVVAFIILIMAKVREQLMTEITGLEEQIGEMKTDIRQRPSSLSLSSPSSGGRRR